MQSAQLHFEQLFMMHILNSIDAITGYVPMQKEDVPAPVVVCAKAGEEASKPAEAQANVQVNAACCFVIVSFVLCGCENSVAVSGNCHDAVQHCLAAAGLPVV